ncbi:cytochrome c [Maribellus mangrovi]|uniref:cytochrome c n=1 Tax=Maribellus mangrovi TaxID=3133146 RepID=UPI0030EF6B96
MKIRISVIMVLILVAVLGFIAYTNLFREVPVIYTSDEDLFKYGSLGTEKSGLPFYVWEVFPQLFPEYLPAGADGMRPYSYFGFIWEDGRDIPIGLSKKTIGFPRLGVNCAMCHTGTFRTQPNDKSKLILAGSAPQFDVQAYQRFLFKCVNDPKFSPENVVNEIKKNHDLSLTKKLIYRYLIVPKVKNALLEREENVAWLEDLPPHGPGRSGLGLLSLPLGIPQEDTETVGGYDIMTLWNAKAHRGQPIHWDGFNTKRFEVFLSASATMGAVKKDLEMDNLRQLEKYLDEIQPPDYPFLINNELAGKGQKIFVENCASCHAAGHANVGKVIDIDLVGTDPYRLSSWPESAVKALEEWSTEEEYDSIFTHFRKTNGYKAVPLDGIWATAPYLHNGSVPTLMDLLLEPENRPKVFYRGYDVIDSLHVGFVSDVPEESGYKFFRYNTSDIGNSNQGHTYGTHLSLNEKKSLVEYMKTL